MREHNNRKKAKAYAEYITGLELRQYVAKKVREYVPDVASVFDGACGSGQLEEYLDVDEVYGVEIQREACEAFRENFPQGEVYEGSFFEYEGEVVCDAVVMNPPFSMAFKDLSEGERKKIQEDFPWKKSGKADEIFILKSLDYTRRYAFHIAFPGIAYRKTEKRFRGLIGPRLAELDVVRNAFEDTDIDVIFLVIDKGKTEPGYTSEVYDCKTGEVVATDSFEVSDEGWEEAREEVEVEPIDIDEVNADLDDMALAHVRRHLEIMFLIRDLFGDITTARILAWINSCEAVLNEYKDRILES